MKQINKQYYSYYFPLRKFDLFNFKKEVLKLFYPINNLEDSRIHLYHSCFTLGENSLYYAYLLDINGDIICRIPFKLLSLDDKEDLIEDVFNLLSFNLCEYLGELKGIINPDYVGLYISNIPEEFLYYEDIFDVKDLCLLYTQRIEMKLLLTRLLSEK